MPTDKERIEKLETIVKVMDSNMKKLLKALPKHRRAEAARLAAQETEFNMDKILERIDI